MQYRYIITERKCLSFQLSRIIISFFIKLLVDAMYEPSAQIIQYYIQPEVQYTVHAI